jgi:hypothetical protein
VPISMTVMPERGRVLDMDAFLLIRPRYRPSPGTIAKIIGLLILCAAGLFVSRLPWSHWDRFYELALGFAAAVFAAVVVGRRLRHAFMVVASVVL